MLSSRLHTRLGNLFLLSLSVLIAFEARESQAATTAQSKRTYRFEQPNISFDNLFDGARLNGCELREGEYHLYFRPENTPVNDSAWYAFRVQSDQPRTVTLRLIYEQGAHRYRPKVSSDGMLWQAVPEESLRAGRRDAVLQLQVGPDPLFVAAQELITAERVGRWATKVARHDFVRRQTIGKSVEGRPIRKLEIGQSKLGNRVFIMSRQHPPEVTGAIGMMCFVDTLCGDSPLAVRFREQFQTTVVPLANPDGVARGNWRHNANGVDLNRDWKEFQQAETRVLRDELLKIREQGRLCLFLDFHSTYHDVFYTHADSPAITPSGFTRMWLASLQRRFPSYAVRRDTCASKPGTSRQWVCSTFAAPAITYEFGDTASREHIQRLSCAAAEEMMRSLLQMDSPSKLAPMHPRGTLPALTQQTAAGAD